MKKKLFSVLSLSALAVTAMSLSSCGLTDEELFEQNAQYVFLVNNGPAGAGRYYNVTGELVSYTAFTEEFIEKGGKVEWSSNNPTLIDAAAFNSGTTSIPVNKPDFGSETAEVEITATVTMGSFTKNVQWNLFVEPKSIENTFLAGAINKYFYGRTGNPENNAAQETAIKTDADGNTIIAMFVVNSANRASNRPTIAQLVENGGNKDVEFVNTKTAGAAVNINEDSSEELIQILAQDIKQNVLNAQLADGDNVTTVYECFKEIAENKEIFGQAISDSDYNAIKNLGIGDIINHVIEAMGDSSFSAIVFE